MGLLDLFFGGKSPSPQDLDKLPPIHGGDALSPQTAAIVNCASMNLANILINSYITERHGKMDADWKRVAESFVNQPSIPEFSVRRVSISTSSKEIYDYYFNLARPMNATQKMMASYGS